MSIVLEQVHEPTDDVRLLVGELDAELSGVYSEAQQHGLSVERIFRPGILFFIARLDGAPAGCGGIAFEDDFAEVKRMYVRPAARGHGVAQAILAKIESEARARAVKRLTLETGDVRHAAMRLYERAGFTRCNAFGAYTQMPPSAVERSVFYEKIFD
jgi:putative acetyltransferase